jgi:low temperature requirement protein LtrA
MVVYNRLSDGRVGLHFGDGVSETGASALVEDRIPEQQVTPLELFFDLVFVFSLTQVTGFLADDPSWAGLLKGLAILAALWWPWVGYAWLTNAVPVEERIPARLVVFGAMAAMLVAALAVPGAFGGSGVIFGAALVVVAVLHAALYVITTRAESPDVSGAIFRLAPGFVLGPVLLVIAGFLDSGLQAALWASSLVTSYGVALVLGVKGFQVKAGTSWSATGSSSSSPSASPSWRWEWAPRAGRSAPALCCRRSLG